jgi:exopolysaccharide biosynthesis protein
MKELLKIAIPCLIGVLVLLIVFLFLTRGKKISKTVMLVLNRLFGFLFLTGVLVGIGALGAGYIATRAEYPNTREKFVMTMEESRRFRFVPRVFLTQTEMDEFVARRDETMDEVMDPSLIHVAALDTRSETADPSQPDIQSKDDYGLLDEDGDGYILVPVSGPGFNGYMLIVLDPTRCFVARGGNGQTINLIAERTGAIGGINGGAFRDEKGGGSGEFPEGLTIIDGQMIEAARWGEESFVGFDSQGILHVGYFTYADCLDMDIVGGVSFSPPLIINGVPQDTSWIPSGVNPRTAIGQRADGAVLMLAINGRQLSSAGATYSDVIDVMLQFGAVNAMNLDGGSSTVMYLNGELVNTPSSESGYSRGLPDAFMFR